MVSNPWIWQNKNMKERFWSVYYWLMISYLFLALITIVEYQNTYKLVEATHYQTNLKCEAHNKRMLEINNLKYEAWKQELKDSGEDFIGLPAHLKFHACLAKSLYVFVFIRLVFFFYSNFLWFNSSCG